MQGLFAAGSRGSVIFYHDLILVNLDDTGALLCDHLVIYFIYHTFILEPAKVFYFFQVMGIDVIA